MAANAPASTPVRTVGRYALFAPVAQGGTATIHLGRLLGEIGFARTVAIKRLREHLAADADFHAMLLDEARLAARIRHPNVVSILDVVADGGELFVVMEYVHGQSLSRLLAAVKARGGRVPAAVASHVLSGALQGLHAAHEATSADGVPLGLVHRDVSPENLLVGADGLPRVADFGVAKALGRLASSSQGQLKGKLGYMSPEHLQGRGVTRQSDVFAAGALLWEALTGERLFAGANDAAVMARLLQGEIAPPSRVEPALPRAADQVVLRALERAPGARYATALEMCAALERAIPPATQREVAEWVAEVAAEPLELRRRLLAEVEGRR